MAFLEGSYLHDPLRNTRHELVRRSYLIWPPVGILFGLLLWKIFSAAIIAH